MTDDAVPLLEVGRISKPHGVRGECFVVLTSDRDERVAPGAVLHAGERALVVTASRRHQHGWIVSFEGVHTRNDAEDLHSAVLRAEGIDDPEVDWVHELIGLRVVDTAGTDLGVVRAVEDNPAADLLVLESGALVPMTFVVGRDPERIVVDPPEGLFDL